MNAKKGEEGMRRSALLSVCALVTSVLVIGFSVSRISEAAPAFAGLTLRVQFWGGEDGRAIKKHIVDPFVEATGANVVIESGNTTASVAKVTAQKNDPQLDVVMLDDIGAVTLERAGILDRLDLSQMPNAREILPNYVIANGHGIGFGTYIDTILYNKSQAPTPTSWRDLWDPRWKGKVILPPATFSSALDLTLMAAKLNGGGLDSIDAAWPLLERLKPNMHSVQGNHALIAELLNTGEALYANDATFYFKSAVLRGYPLAMQVDLKEGFFVRTETIILIKGGKGNRQLAYAFINQALKSESQTALSKDLWYGPTNPNVRLSSLETKWIVYTPEQYAKAIPLDLLKLQTIRPRIIDQYNRIFLR